MYITSKYCPSQRTKAAPGTRIVVRKPTASKGHGSVEGTLLKYFPGYQRLMCIYRIVTVIQNCVNLIKKKYIYISYFVEFENSYSKRRSLL